MGNINNKINKVKGKIEEVRGKATGDKKLETKGRINQNVATAKESINKLKKNIVEHNKK